MRAERGANSFFLFIIQYEIWGENVKDKLKKKIDSLWWEWDRRLWEKSGCGQERSGEMVQVEGL
jgi:hypothetical protein